MARSTISTALILAQLLTIASAQTQSISPSASVSPSITTIATSTSRPTSSNSSAPPQTHTVKVGAGGFFYRPAELNASVGDTVTFEFYPPDHSVARADFESPCVPYEYGGKDRTGFYSGIQNVTDVNHLTYWSLKINDTQPVYYYCTAPDSCLGHQMVGVINPNATWTLDAQIQAAKEATLMVKPGDPIPQEGSATLHLPSSTPASSASSATGAPPDTTHHDHSHLSGGAIAGIVVGAVAFLIISAALFFYVGRSRSLKEVLKRREEAAASTTGAPTPRPEYGQPLVQQQQMQQPGSPGYPSPFSPTHSQHTQPDYNQYGNVPPYSQQQVTDPHPSGWASPHSHQSPMAVAPQSEMADVKPPLEPVEMASPTPQQPTFTAAELEAPMKSPHN